MAKSTLDRRRVATEARRARRDQNGTRHAWRNKSDKPATMLFVLTAQSAG
jgi:hypothetical protein